MGPHLDFAECVRDSPKFRAQLEQAESDVESLESRLEKVTKLCQTMVDAGKAFGSSNSAYIAGLQDLVAHFSGDDAVATPIKRLVKTMSELQNYHAILMDQTYKAVCANFRKFISSDLRSMKDLQKEFKKTSDDLDSALVKHTQAPKARPTECEEANNMLIAARSRFTHTSLDYAFHLNLLSLLKRQSVLGALSTYMQAQSTYFHSGHSLFMDIEQSLKNLAHQVDDMRHHTSAETKLMENRHSFIQSQKSMPDSANAEGYLFKRTSKGFKSWVRRWFCIENHQLVYTKQLSEGFTIMEDDLRLCSVKVASSEVERRFCFEVRSPTRIHVLQATSEEECLRWVSALQAGVAAAYRDADPHASVGGSSFSSAGAGGGSSAALHSSASAGALHTAAHQGSSSTGRDDGAGATGAGAALTATASGANLRGSFGEMSRSGEAAGGVARLPTAKSGAVSKSSSSLRTMSQAQLILSVPGNGFCCDCGSPDPCWASANLGITLCIECSGIHRSLGVHISKVRSLTLDTWEPEMLKVMAEVGNTTFNGVYEANVTAGTVRLEPTSDRARREAWIKNKYVKKAFVKHLLADLPSSPVQLPPNKADAGAESGSAASGPASVAAPLLAVGAAEGSEEKARSLKWSVQIRTRRTLQRRQPEQQQQPAAAGTSRPNDDPAVCRRELQEDVVLFGARVNDADACRPSIDSDSEPDDDHESQQSPVRVAGGSGRSSSSADGVGSGGAALPSPRADADAESRTSLEEVELLDPDMLLYRAAEARNIPVMLEALANGANVNWRCPRANLKTPLIKAVESGSLAACEFLLLNGARVDVADDRGRPPLHHATMTGHTAQVCQLLKRGANQRHRDADGVDAIALAVKAEQADIVTLLRVADLRQQMTDADPGIQSDELFNDVFRDFTNLASSDPDKLKRDLPKAPE